MARAFSPVSTDATRVGVESFISVFPFAAWRLCGKTSFFSRRQPTRLDWPISGVSAYSLKTYSLIAFFKQPSFLLVESHGFRDDARP
jgi:hypothetical protein